MEKKKQVALDSLSPAVTTPPYWGMDILQYPGDNVMQNWYTNSLFWFTGFYLAPAPRQPYTGWMTKRSTLISQGWGLLPIYAGRLYTDTAYLTTAQGKADAQNAASLASQAGFPGSSYIYLDVEQGGILNQNFIDYIVGWVTEINGNTSYWSGIYCSYYSTADQIKAAVAATGTAMPRFYVYNLNYSGTPGSGNAPAPSGSGVSYATVWQLEQRKDHTYGSYTLNIDVDTSTIPDPSK